MALPHCRDLKKTQAGDDVRSIKRAMSRWDPDVYPWVPEDKGGFSRYFGGELEKAIKTFQRRMKLTVTGRMNAGTQSRLESRKNAKGEPVFDSVAEQLMRGFCANYGDAKDRQDIVEAGFYWYDHRWDIAYSQARPFQMRKPPGVPSRWDCSAFATNVYYAAGAKNPNGRPWDGLGYTGTLIANGRKVSLQEAKLGDLVFYGFTTGSSGAFPHGSPTHVAVYVGTVKGVASVLSHGSFPMKLLPVSYRPINQVRTYL